jgi:hypothetical protein
MKSVYQAISYLPPEFITPDMVAAAAREHNPHLLDVLPPEYITVDVIDEIFSVEKSYYFGDFDLSKIPVEYRTGKICELAIRYTTNNLRHVPKGMITRQMVERVIEKNATLSLIHMIPSGIWDEELTGKGIWAILNERQPGQSYHHTLSADKERLMKIQILLRYIPTHIKTRDFYYNLFSKTCDLDFIAFITPAKFKDRRYYMAMAVRDFRYVSRLYWNRDGYMTALSKDSHVTVRDLLDDEMRRESIMSMMDDELADAIVTKDGGYFRNLPEEFQTEERLILILRTLGAKNGGSGFSKYCYPEKLLTQQVVKEFIANSIECEIPEQMWDEELAAFCLGNCKDFFWFRQMPKKLQTRENVLAAATYSEYNLRYARKELISRDVAIKTMRSRCSSRRDIKDPLEYLPENYFTSFTKKTGLPYGCLGGEVSFSDLKTKREMFTYCRLGNMYIGFMPEGKSYDNNYRLIITKVRAGSEPVEIYNNEVATFHKTWIEKAVFDSDPDFVKPQVDSSLKDVQALSYYGVEHLETNEEGFDVYRNTFYGKPVGICVKKDGVTYHADTVEEAINGWRRKVDSEREDNKSSKSGIDLGQVFTADLLHRRYGFCETGMSAFCEDYGLDYHGCYSVGQLRQIIKLQGRKPSTLNYNKELKRIKVID